MIRSMAGKPRRKSEPETKRSGPRKAGKRARPGRVHLYVGVSLDGYIAAPGGGVDWLNPYADARSGFAPFIKTIGSVIMGRVTYDHAVARGYESFGELTSYVVTHRPFASPSPSVVPYTGDLAHLVARIRRRHPGDIWLMGGGVVTRSFQEAGLIDIWTLASVPTFLGAGLPMFPPGAFSEHRVRLVRQRIYGSGVVELRYERAPAASARKT